MKKTNFKTIFVFLFRKPVKVISTGLFGENHSITHRCGVGVIVMIVGVNVAHLSGEVSIKLFGLFFDGIGYLLHGIGAVPFVDLIHNISDKFNPVDEPTEKVEHHEEEK